MFYCRVYKRISNSDYFHFSSPEVSEELLNCNCRFLDHNPSEWMHPSKTLPFPDHLCLAPQSHPRFHLQLMHTSPHPIPYRPNR